MGKNIVIGAIVGMLIGLVVGFSTANYLNRNEPAVLEMRPPAPAAAPPGTNNPMGQDQASMLKDVQSTLDKARENPQSAEAQILAGDLYLEIQRFDEALGFYSKALELEPDNFEANANIGQIYFKKNEFKKAGEYYAKALTINKSNPGLRNDLGLTFYLREPAEPNRAMEEYRKALDLDPNHELALQNLSVALKDLGEADELKETLERLKKVNGNNPALKALSAS